MFKEIELKNAKSKNKDRWGWGRNGFFRPGSALVYGDAPKIVLDINSVRGGGKNAPIMLKLPVGEMERLAKDILAACREARQEVGQKA